MDDSFATGYALGQNDNSNNGGMFGGDWGGLLGLIVIAALFGGNGFGFGGFGGGGAGLQGMATRADINEGFAFNNLQNGVRSIEQGLCDGFYGVQGQLANMAAGQASCCCETQRLLERGFADTNYNLATQVCSLQNTLNNNTRDIVEATNAGTRAILGRLTDDKISSLQAENQALRFSASQDRQNAYLTTFITAQNQELRNQVAPIPVPSYNVPAPYPYGIGWNNNGCGCA